MNYEKFIKTKEEGFKKILLDRFKSMNLKPIKLLDINSVSRLDDFSDYIIEYTIVAYNRYDQLLESKHRYYINSDKFEYIDNSLKEV